jgi:hypothetical protein
MINTWQRKGHPFIIIIIIIIIYYCYYLDWRQFSMKKDGDFLY